MQLINLKKVSLRRTPRINEKWIQEQISSNPSILGLGDLILKDIERNHRGADRLDSIANRISELEEKNALLINKQEEVMDVVSRKLDAMNGNIGKIAREGGIYAMN